MATVCTVTGILRWSSGALAKSVAVHVVQPGIRRTWDGAALPIVASATSDAVTGVVTFDLIPGFYQLVWQDDLGAVQAGMRVPDEATADLQDIVQAQTAAIAPAPGDTGYPYDNDTCRIVGTLRWPSGDLAAGATVHIVQDAIRPAWDGAALPVVQAITADGNGEVDFDLIPGHYRMVWQDATAQAQHRLYVPDAPLVYLQDAASGSESPWTPAFLFARGQPGFWAGGFDPDAGRVYQTSAGGTPTESFEQPAGLVERAWGTADAVQTVSSRRPTMARWPRGGRRNLRSYSESFDSNWNKGDVLADEHDLIALVTPSAVHHEVFQPYPFVTNKVYTVSYDVSALASDYVQFYVGGSPQNGGYANIDISEMTILQDNGGLSNVSLLDLGNDTVRVSFSYTYSGGTANYPVLNLCVNPSAVRPDRFIGDGVTAITRLHRSQFEEGAVATPYQKVTTSNDVTEEGVESLWHLYNDGGDSLNATLPNSTYGRAWVDPYGEVHFDEVTGTEVNATPAERTVDSLIREGAFSPAEQDRLRDYWEGLYK